MAGAVEDLHELVVDAFEAARRSGRSDWRSMSSAVLKNRLLQRSNGTFREADWGFDSFRDLLLSGVLDPVAEVDTSDRPTRIILRNKAPSPEADVPVVEPDRIVRRDLWRAVVDLSGRHDWHWDPTEGRVVEDTNVGIRVEPIPREEMQRWRTSFAGSLAGTPSAGVVGAWLDDRQGSGQLPGRLRNEWYALLKSHVIAYLEGWFSTNGLTPPHDLVIEVPGRSGPHVAHDEGDVERLRNQIIEAVRRMSPAEVRLVQLPAAALLRRRS